MNQLDKIDYMIKSLYIAKDEIEYARAYYLRRMTDESYGHYFYSGYGKNHRVQSGTTIRDSLRMVGRMANQIANECTLTQYCDSVFKENE